MKLCQGNLPLIFINVKVTGNLLTHLSLRYFSIPVSISVYIQMSKYYMREAYISVVWH